MEKQSHNKFKIKYILLSILFMILVIFTALNISPTLTAYADTTSTERRLRGHRRRWSIRNSS